MGRMTVVVRVYGVHSEDAKARNQRMEYFTLCYTIHWVYTHYHHRSSPHFLEL
jgi:hypothetical protein